MLERSKLVVQRLEAFADRLAQLRVLLFQLGLQQLIDFLRTLHVRCEIVQVGMGIPLLFAGHLGSGYFVKQLDRARHEERGIDARCFDLGPEKLGIAQQTVGVFLCSGGLAVLPEQLLDSVEAPPFAVIHIAFPGVDIRIKITERFGNRLDSFIVHSRGRVQVLRFLQLAGFDGLNEGFRLLDEFVAFGDHILAVLRDRGREIRLGGG
ncbi:hypothetical protein D3C71_1120350 [compost metagenome]